ncbi:MAG: PilN domain-containing protein [Rubrobacteraceae bacterium]|uniref:PilN domain-containing protein n=1 Tax=Rubrobacter naiadicus TaxID=1392641 RepID=UPI002362A338|nr:PilN domain-containing protein [Rubrobacter naiadicus]MCL6438125.1 PilN domain-containing protein [Rubrobacteraceae bacterium]
MRRVNLLPEEERRRAGLSLRERNVMQLLLISGATLLVLMVGVYVLYLVRINAEEGQIAHLDRQISAQRARLAELAPYRGLEARLHQKETIADGIYRSRFAWDAFFRALSYVIPDTTALNGLSAKAPPVNVNASPGQELTPPGEVSFTGVALDSYTNVAAFMVQLDSLPYLRDTRLNSATLDRSTYVRPVINFDVTSQLVVRAGQEGKRLPLEGASGSRRPRVRNGGP